MNINFKALRRPAAVLSALALVVGSIAPIFSSGVTSALQVQDRSIQMSNSLPGATGVTYKIQFNVATSGNIRAINVDFCQESPLIEDTNCTLPTGMSFGGVGLANVTNLNPTTGWTARVFNGSHTVEIYNNTAGNVNTPTTVSYELTGVTNPTSTGTFYARIMTYATGDGATQPADTYTSGTTTGVVDFGGIALSTATRVLVTAKVQEQLSFCVSAAAIPDDCVTLSTPNVNLGALTGGNYILTTTSAYTGSAYTRISTNALSGAIVRVKTTSSTTCSGLSSDNGTSCAEFPVVGSTATTLGTGTAGFGWCVVPGAASAEETPYDNAVNCSSNNGTTQWVGQNSAATGTYGDNLFNTGGTPVNLEDNRVNYGVSRSNVTPAGIYTTTQSMIATGTF